MATERAGGGRVGERGGVGWGRVKESEREKEMKEDQGG